MTAITLRAWLDGNGSPTPAHATFTATMMARDSSGFDVPAVRLIAADATFAKPVVVELVDGVAPAGIDLVQPPLNMWWRVQLEVAGVRGKLTRDVRLPDGDGPFDVGELVLFNPESATPLDPVPPSLAELLERAEETLEEVIAHGLTATIDPDEPGVLILSFPTFMLYPDETSVAIPIMEAV